MAGYESPRTTKLYDRRSDVVSLDEVPGQSWRSGNLVPGGNHGLGVMHRITRANAQPYSIAVKSSSTPIPTINVGTSISALPLCSKSHTNCSKYDTPVDICSANSFTGTISTPAEICPKFLKMVIFAQTLYTMNEYLPNCTSTPSFSLTKSMSLYGYI